MPLTAQEASPGNRINHPDFGEVDIVATISSDIGSLLLLSNGATIVQGHLYDDGTDAFYVGATAGIKQEAAEKAAEAEKAQIDQDRKEAAAARAAANPPSSPFSSSLPGTPDPNVNATATFVPNPPPPITAGPNPPTPANPNPVTGPNPTANPTT